MILQRLPDEVTILKAVAGTDEYGNRVKTVDVTEFDRTRGFLQNERGAGGETVSSERSSVSSFFSLYLPAGAKLSARDQVRIDGVTYTVEGEPIKARGINGTSHLKARLRKIEG